MKSLLCLLIIMVVGLVHAQQSSQYPPNAPPSTPPTFPQDQALPQEAPPDSPAPSDRQLTPVEVQRQIQQNFKDEPALATSDVSVEVTDNAVMLSGTVERSDGR